MEQFTNLQKYLCYNCFVQQWYLFYSVHRLLPFFVNYISYCENNNLLSKSMKKKLHLFASSPFKSSLVKNLCVVFGSKKKSFFFSIFFFSFFLSFPWRLSLQYVISYHVRLEVTQLCHLTHLQLFQHTQRDLAQEAVFLFNTLFWEVSCLTLKPASPQGFVKNIHF